MAELHVNTQSVQSGAGPEEEGGARQVSEYCKDQLTRGQEEMSIEELRAERYFLQRQRNVEERLKSLTEMKELLSHELEEKRKLLLWRESQQTRPDCPGGTSGDPQEPGSCSTSKLSPIQETSVEAGAWSLLEDQRQDQNQNQSQDQDQDQNQVQDQNQDEAGAWSLLEDQRQDQNQNQDQSQSQDQNQVQDQNQDEAGTWSLLEDQRQDQDQSQDQSLDQNQNQEEVEPGPLGGAVDACDPEARQQLLDICDVTSCPGFHCESGPLPPVNSCLQLGGDLYHIYSRVVEEEMFSVYKGATNDHNVLLKVERCRVPWDFHQFGRLKGNWSEDSLPQISCFLFLDGCITVYTCPPDHMFMELTACADSVVRKSLLLLQLVTELHARHVLHAALRPSILVACYRGLHLLERVFPVDWSSSVDVDVQQEVTSAQQLASAHSYIRAGVLEPTSPPQLVDLLGVAETVHVLLTSSRMVPVRDDHGWTAERFSQHESCDMSPGTWTTWSRVFRSLLNAGGRCSMSVLSDVSEQLSLLLK